MTAPHLTRHAFSPVRQALLAFGVFTALSVASGCNDSSSADDADGTCGSSASNGSGGEAGGDRTLFAVATAVSTDSGANTYVKVLSKFEDELDLSNAREFPGWSDIAAVGKYLFVSSGEEPIVWRFTVSESGKLVGGCADETLDFGAYASDANFYNQMLVSETKAYLIGEGEYVVWNPSTLEIEGTVPFPALPERSGIPAFVGLDRSAVVRDGRLYHTASWSDTENLEFLPDSRIIVLDTETDEVIDVIDAPCPDLAVGDRDEQGNMYFSNWVYSPGGTLLFDGPATCAVRIPAGSEELDADWSFGYAAADGHEGATMGYLGDGKWLYSSFTNDPANYEDDWFEWLFGNFWQLRTLDPETMETATVEGAPLNGGGYYTARVEDTTHVLLPGDSYTTTTVYAIGADGTAAKKMHMAGWSTRMVQLR